MTARTVHACGCVNHDNGSITRCPTHDHAVELAMAMEYLQRSGPIPSATTAPVVIQAAAWCLEMPGRGPAGFAAVVKQGQHEIRLIGGDPDTTYTAMTMTAIMEAIAEVRRTPGMAGAPITVRSNSNYVVMAWTRGWLARWRQNGWTTTKKTQVELKDKWEQLETAVQGASVTWEWIPRPDNERTNSLCNNVAHAMAQAAARRDKPWTRHGFESQD